ncbi:MAG: TrmH family RNA methyltransferase [Anaerolineales bacterium]
METKNLITSSSNQVIKLVRSLYQKKKRDESGLFLVEGIHHVGALFESGWGVASILYAPELLTSDYGLQLIRQREEQGDLCYRINSDLFRKIADKDHPQGIIAIARKQTLTIDQIDKQAFQWGIAVVDPQDPGNVGTIIRTLDSVGADGLILLDGGVDPFHPSCVRASMGALFWKPVLQTSFEEMSSWAQVNGYQMIGSSAHSQMDYRILSNVKRPCILLLGSEQKGLTPEQVDACDIVVSLPMRGHSSSLNLSIAAGILMYAMFPGEN